MFQHLARNLLLFRTDRGYTQPHLSKVSGLSQQYISALERGLRPSDSKHVAALAAALGVTPSALLEPLTIHVGGEELMVAGEHVAPAK